MSILLAVFRVSSRACSMLRRHSAIQWATTSCRDKKQKHWEKRSKKSFNAFCLVSLSLPLGRHPHCSVIKRLQILIHSHFCAHPHCLLSSWSHSRLVCFPSLDTTTHNLPCATCPSIQKFGKREFNSVFLKLVVVCYICRQTAAGLCLLHLSSQWSSSSSLEPN